MLKHLYISQFALIDELDLDIKSGFTVITGETGAGKSIIMGALALIMGSRADSKAVRAGAKKCVVEARFDLKDSGLEFMFNEADLDYEDECVIRREVTSIGKSRAFINDTPVNQQQLRVIASRLIDIHSQHENLLLNDNDFQLRVVDIISGSQSELESYQIAYKKHSDCYAKLKELKNTAEQFQSEKDFAQYQYDQLEEASLCLGEQKELEEELEKLNHAEEIKGYLSEAEQRLDDEQYGVVNQLRETVQNIDHVGKYLKEAESLVDRVNSLYLELKDVTSEISSLYSNMEFDPQRKNWVEERLNILYSLEQKHHVDSDEELINIKNDFQTKLLRIDSFDEEIYELEKKEGELFEVLKDKADILSNKRRNIKDVISNYLVQKLVYLGMNNAQVEVLVDDLENYGITGRDKVDMVFTANKNTPLRSIVSIASGGEIARFMLALKSLIAKSSALKTIIFDEIDTGVSGDVAGRMGEMMSQISDDIQVITITHLPQIAGKGDNHFKVYKVDEEAATVTHIVELDIQQRELEIAEMLSGKNPTETAIKTAKELLR